jgi:GTP-binding protein
MPKRVAIIGRPNVGKSTLFNRLAGRRLALVHDTPGVTRDRREAPAALGDLRFTIIDTAGLDEGEMGALGARMQAQTEIAVEGADVVLFVVDARAGLTPLDGEFVRALRRLEKPTILIANKAERGAGSLDEFFALGLGEPIAMSAEHGEGLGGLYDALAPLLGETEAAAEQETDKPLKLAIIGRPNVGKSTLVNRLVGQERMLTGPEAGITRDAIAIPWRWRDKAISLVDTAGLRRRPKVEGKLEQLSVGDTLSTIRFAEVCVLVVDATQLLEKQDLTIAREVAEEGRALVLAVNKWDIAENKSERLKDLAEILETGLPQLAVIKAVTLSAKTGANIDKLMPAVFAAHEAWNRRIPTPQLNRWLAEAQARNPPPLVSGRPLRLRYMTQANIRPPTFALFASKPGDLPESYTRYLVNLLRDTFDLPGVPIRMMLRKGKNPYEKK